MKNRLRFDRHPQFDVKAVAPLLGDLARRDHEQRRPGICRFCYLRLDGGVDRNRILGWR